MKVEFLEEEKIVGQVERFREKYYSNKIPVDIEGIIEVKLEIEIRPEIGIREHCDSDALITSDFKVVVVDNEMYLDSRYDNRLRFSLAHELAHLVLHKKLYSNLNINSIKDGYTLIDRLSKREYRSLEWQAHRFASHLLIPRKILKKELDILKQKISEKYPELENVNELNGYLAIDLAKKFGVSEQAVEIAIKDIS